jgi:hypothetical protein
VTIARSNTPAVALTLYWFCLVALFIALRLNLSAVELNIDEWIPLKVSEGMSARGDLDPNWRLADLPWYFKVDQYNFYLYSMVSHAVIKLAAWFAAPALPALRFANVMLQLLALAFSIDALRRIGSDRFTLALAGALIAVAPGPVQDAGMARPESLLYLVVALQIWVVTVHLSDRWIASLSGLILGAGMAIKASYGLAAILIAAPWLMTYRERSIFTFLSGAAVFGIGAALGFVVSAPYAVMHPQTLMTGLADLHRHYTYEDHPPHSLPTYTVVGQTLWMGTYLFQLYVLVPIAALAAPFLLKGRARAFAAGFGVVVVLLFVYFVGKRVFFERNLSFVLIPMLLAAALAVSALRASVWRIAAALVLLLPMAYWSFQIARSVHDRKGVARFEAATGLTPTVRLSFDDAQHKKAPPPCKTAALEDLGDPWTVEYIANLKAQGFVPIARYRSRFSGLVASTLQTYLEADRHYFRCPDG